MIKKILGILDIMCSIILLASSILPRQFLVLAGIYLVFKGIFFGLILGISFNHLDIVSIIDGVIGGFMLLGIQSTFFKIAFFIFLVQKGLFSLF